MASTRAHWEQLWGQRDEQDVSWFQSHPDRSLELIREVAPEADMPIIDVGGGASRLVDALLETGYRDVTVLPLSDRARRPDPVRGPARPRRDLGRARGHRHFRRRRPDHV